MASHIGRSVALASLLVLSVVASTVAFVGVAAAANNPSIVADPPTPGERSNHTVTVTAAPNEAGSIEGFEVNYSNADVDLSGVRAGDVRTIGIDRGDNRSRAGVDVDISDDLQNVSVGGDGGTLTFNLTGNYSLDGGDELVVSYGNVVNPSSAGNYSVGLEISPGVSGGEATTQLTIGTGNAAVSFPDQQANSAPSQEPSNVTVRINSTYLPDGGFVVVHEAENGSPGQVIGNSTYLEPGTHENVTVVVERNESVSDPQAENETLIAMAHNDSNDNQRYEFGRVEGADGPYTADGGPVIDNATIRYSSTLAMTTMTQTTGGGETTADGETTDGGATDGAGTTETGGQAGFGLALAAGVLAALAFLAARRT